MGKLNGRANAEQIMMTLAARQHGLVARTQLLRAGVTPDLIDHRVRAGRLRRVHRGVYLVGPLTTPQTRAMAAVLACGEGTVLSHRSAAALWRIMPDRGDRPVEVVVTRGRAGRQQDLRARHIRSILPDEITVRYGIPVTTPARTLFDLAAAAADRELERALAEAFALRLVRRALVSALLGRHAGRHGAARLRRLLQGAPRFALTRSEAEERVLALIRRAGIPDPEANVEIAGQKVDFLWRAEQLVVEVDGRAFHSSDLRFESDRRRDAVLVAAGLRVIRVTWQHIVSEPEALLVRLAFALARSPEG